MEADFAIPDETLKTVQVSAKTDYQQCGKCGR